MCFLLQGFPTLVYGDPLAAEIYEGDRTYEALSAHAKTFIDKPICSVRRIDACSDDDKKIIQDLQALSNEDLEAVAQKVADRVQLEEAVFQEQVEEIQQKYDALVKVFNDKLDAIKKEFNYKYVEQVMGDRMEDAADSENDEL
jgi:hypothetical protein